MSFTKNTINMNQKFTEYHVVIIISVRTVGPHSNVESDLDEETD